MDDQLDIIDDTVHANGTHSSSVRNGDAGTHSSSLSKILNGTHSSSVAKSGAGTHSSSVDRGTVMKKIEVVRVESKISIAKLCAEAKVHPNTYRELRRGACTPQDITLVKLTKAVQRIRASEAEYLEPPQVVVAFHRLLMHLLARQLSFDLDQLRATDFAVQRPFNPQWLAAARIRQMAIYIMAVEMEVSNADLGRALGLTRANIKYARDEVEQRREDGNEIDQALTAVLLQVKA